MRTDAVLLERLQLCKRQWGGFCRPLKVRRMSAYVALTCFSQTISIGILGDEAGRMFEEGDVRNFSDTIRRGFSVLASAVVYM